MPLTVTPLTVTTPASGGATLAQGELNTRLKEIQDYINTNEGTWGAGGSVLTTKGDLLTRTTTTVVRIGVGTDGQVLTSDAAQTTGNKWALPHPLTTKGDVFTFGTIAARLAVGSNDQVLTADSAQALGVKWAAPDPLTTKGDLLTRSSTVRVRLAVGADNRVLIADVNETSGMKWGQEPLSYLTTKGDLIAYSTAPGRVAVGTDGQVLTARASATPGVAWETPGEERHGECRLDWVSTTTIRLSRFNGTKLRIRTGTVWAFETIPSGGVDLSTGGLAASTAYFIYAKMVAGVMTLEASTTGHTRDTTTGVEVLSTDATRTLVGWARTNASTQWVDSLTQRFTLSWFNRRPLALRNTFTADKTRQNATLAELDSAMRLEFGSWGQEAGIFFIGARVFGDAAGDRVFSALAPDGTAVTDFQCAQAAPAASYEMYASHHYPVVLAEGYHFVAFFGASEDAASVATWKGAASAGSGLGGCVWG